MHDGGFRRWMMWGALASASWLVAACGILPENAGNETFRPGFVRSPAQAGYNGTIEDIPTSIDPRTPETAGTPGRSLRMDLGERALLEQQGRGGSGEEDVILEAVPGTPGADGSMYGGSGAEGAAPIPGEREFVDPDADAAKPASKGRSGDGAQRR